MGFVVDDAVAVVGDGDGDVLVRSVVGVEVS